MSRYSSSSPEYKQSVMARTRRRRLNDPARYLWEKARTRARKSSLAFTIKVSDVVVPDQCPVLGIEIGPLRGGIHGATIDRIHNSKGYVPGNIVIVSMRANRIKSDATIDELQRIARFYARLRTR